MGEYKTEIELFRPPAGKSLQVAMRPGQSYVLDFEPYAAEFTLDGADLYLNFGNGAVLSLKDFMTAAGTGDFTLRLPDGVQISGKDTAESLAFPVADFHTEEAPVPPARAAFGGEPPTLSAESAPTWEQAVLPVETLHAADLLASLQPEQALFAEECAAFPARGEESADKTAMPSTPTVADIFTAGCAPAPDYGELPPWFLIFPGMP
ncbi:MAG: hypothetical protein LBP38_07700 [Desulfovibrio sp.]|jgi:hypothetical protein|nr:hypothetical protein [Desulfovibrio sp.]